MMHPLGARMAAVVIAAAVALGAAACTDPAPGTSPASGGASSQAPSQSGQSASPSPSSSSPASQGPAATQSPAPSTPASSSPDGPVAAAPLPTTASTLDAPVVFDTGITVAIDSVMTIDVTAETPGEVSGSAVQVTVTASNGTTEAQSVDSAVVTVSADDGEVGIGTTAGSPAPLAGDIAPSANVTGVYIFMLGDVVDRAITVSVNYAAGEPVAAFTGIPS